jgi:uncharacterized membrane protein
MAGEMTTTRTEAFSDGVIAIAITLLVLDIKVPEPGTHGRLGQALADQWPSYAAYVVSFVTIGIIWINHHATLHRVRRIDQGLLVLNLLLLLTIGVLPFTTSLMAAYLRESDGQHLAAAVYGGSYLLLGCVFFGLQRYVLSPGRKLYDERIDDTMRRYILRRNAVGLIPYAVAVAVAPLSSYATLLICGAVALYYALPGRPSSSRTSQ